MRRTARILLFSIALAGLTSAAQAQRPPTIAEMQNADYVVDVCNNVGLAANVVPPQYKEAMGRTACDAVNADGDPARLVILVGTDARVFASKENKRLWLTHVSIITEKSLEKVPKFRVYEVWFADKAGIKAHTVLAIAPDKLRRPVALFTNNQAEAGYAELTRNLTQRHVSKPNKR